MYNVANQPPGPAHRPRVGEPGGEQQPRSLRAPRDALTALWLPAELLQRGLVPVLAGYRANANISCRGESQVVVQPLTISERKRPDVRSHF